MNLENKGDDFSHSLTALIHHMISNTYIICRQTTRPVVLVFFFETLRKHSKMNLFPFQTTLPNLRVCVTSCLLALSLSVPKILFKQPPGPLCRRGGSGELCHLAIFGHRFLPAFPQQHLVIGFRLRVYTHERTDTLTEQTQQTQTVKPC